MNLYLVLTVIPYAYHCHHCKEYITERTAIGIRTDTNYYYHLEHHPGLLQYEQEKAAIQK